MDIENVKNEKYYRYSERGIKSRNFDLWEKISNIKISVPFKEKFFIFENKLKNIPKCYCGEDLKFVDMKKGYREFCSKRCM